MNHKMILVVDEDEVTTDVIESTLNTRYRVLSVPEGKRAIELAPKEGIEIALISRCLPDIDGLEVLRTLINTAPSISVIFVATAPTKDLIIAAFRSGAKDFLEKPINTETLLASIKRVTRLNGKNPHIASNEKTPAVSSDQKFFSSIRPNRIFASGWFRRLGKLTGLLGTDSQRKESEEGHKANKPTITTSIDEIPPPEQGEQEEHEEHEEHEEQGEMITLKEGLESYQREEEQGDALTPTLSVYCLGKFQVILDGQVIENWTSRKGRALFTYLVMNHKRRTYRDVLMETFWPNSDPDSARNSLNVAVHSVRRLLHMIDPDHEYVLFQNECYFINPEIDVWVDVEEFLYHWKLAKTTEREKEIQTAVAEYELAAAAYKGDFLEEDLYENWPSAERENFQEIYLFILDRLSKYYSLDGKPSTAISLCETILEKDNCREDIHRRLMRCYCKLGQRDKAVKQFRKCTEVLETELEVEPTRATIDLYKQIKQDFLGAEEK